MAVDVLDPPTTEEEEKLALEREQRDREEAERILAEPGGEIAPTKFRLQITGGEVELAPSKSRLFRRDSEYEVDVAGIPFRAWVKTDKTVTDKKGEAAARVAVLVLEPPDDGDQLRLGEDE